MADILAMQIIPRVNTQLAKELQLADWQQSVGIVTLTIDDVGYTAIDEATKKADVEVVYAKSFYAAAAQRIIGNHFIRYMYVQQIIVNGQLHRRTRLKAQKRRLFAVRFAKLCKALARIINIV